MIKRILKKQEGIAGADALVAVLIFSLFTALIVSIVYNIYVQSVSVKRKSEATNYIVEIFEYADKELYENVTEDLLLQYVSNKNDSKISAKQYDDVSELTTPYKIQIKVEKLSDLQPEKLDLIKIITIRIEYEVANKVESIEMTKLKLAE